MKVFDAETLSCRVVIPAHEGQLAALQFSRTNTRIATASLKGTVIRVFDTRDGAKLYELRRGLKRTASIFSLSFSPCGTFLACSSNTETVHVFKLDERCSSRYKCPLIKITFLLEFFDNESCLVLTVLTIGLN